MHTERMPAPADAENSQSGAGRVRLSGAQAGTRPDACPGTGTPAAAGYASRMLTRRNLLQSAAALAAISAGREASAGAVAATSTRMGPEGLPWFRRSPRVFLLDFQMPDPADQSVPGMPARFFQNLSPERIVEQVAAAHVNTLLVHAKDNQGNAYYNTKAAHKHSCIGDRDLMAEFSQLCRRRGMNLLYYVQLTRERRSFQHPDRQARDVSGQPVISMRDRPLAPSKEEAPVVCLNGPHRQYIRDILAELSAGYDFDGFWLDCFGWWGRVSPCYCEFCQAAYNADIGSPIPTRRDAEAMRTYLHWRRRLNSRLLHELQDLIRSINPRLTITHNGSGVRNWADWDFCDRDDYVCEEFHYNEGPGHLAFTCRQNRALKPSAPFEIEIWRFSNSLGGFSPTSRGYQVRPTATLLTEMATVAALGGFPQYYDQVRPDGTIEPRSLERVTPAFAEVARRQAFTLAGDPALRPVPYAAVLWSKTTETFAERAAGLLHADDLEGTVSALVESHIPVWLLTERDVARGEFHGARVLIVPSVEVLPRSLIEPLTRFVEGGGGLIVTARTGLQQPAFDPLPPSGEPAGNPLNVPATAPGQDREATVHELPNFSLASLIGLDYAGMTETTYTYFSFGSPSGNEQVTRELPLDFPITVYNALQTQTRVPMSTGSTGVLARIVAPMRGFHMGFPPDQLTDFPAVTARRAGAGRVLYCAAPLGALYRRFSHGDYRQLIANAARWAAGAAPPLSADAPETVEVVLWQDPEARRTIVHLVNRTGAGLPQGHGQVMHRAIPVHDIVLRLSHGLAPTRRAFLEPEHEPLNASLHDDALVLHVPQLEIWQTISLE